MNYLLNSDAAGISIQLEPSVGRRPLFQLYVVHPMRHRQLWLLQNDSMFTKSRTTTL